MLGGVVTQTGTPWRPKLLAIERPLRFPPITNAPVASLISRRPVPDKTPNGSETLCAHCEEGIIRVRRRVVRRPERDRPQLSRRRNEVVRLKNNACRRRIASAGRNSKWLAPQESAISVWTIRNPP